MDDLREELAAHNGLVAGSAIAEAIAIIGEVKRFLGQIAVKRSPTDYSHALNAAHKLKTVEDILAATSIQQPRSEAELDFSSWGDAQTIGEIGVAHAQRPSENQLMARAQEAKTSLDSGSPVRAQLARRAAEPPAPDYGCYTRADGECISTGPCMHSVAAPAFQEHTPKFGVEGFGYSKDLMGALRWVVHHLDSFDQKPEIKDGYVTLKINVPIFAFPPINDEALDTQGGE